MSDTNQYEENCQMCHRNEQNAGKMYHLPGGVCICEDCMKKTMDAMSRFGFAPMPEMTHDELQMVLDQASEYGIRPDGAQKAVTPEETPGEEKEETMDRAFVVIEKTGPISKKYPRNAGKPAKQPLA